MDIYILNKNGSIQAQCCFGRQYNLRCNQQYHSTELWAITCENHIKPVYVPIIKCTYHSKLSKIYGWTSNDDKFIPGHGDEIVNFFDIWTLIKFNNQDKNWRCNNIQRYHFSDLALEGFTDHFIVSSYVLSHSLCLYLFIYINNV